MSLDDSGGVESVGFAESLEFGDYVLNTLVFTNVALEKSPLFSRRYILKWWEFFIVTLVVAGVKNTFLPGVPIHHWQTPFKIASMSRDANFAS